MPRFRVYEANSKGRAFALHDGDGLCHVARSLEAMPPVGADLEGPPPELGSCTLQCAETGLDYPVVFDAVGWDRQATLEHLHPRLIRGVMPTLRSS